MDATMYQLQLGFQKLLNNDEMFSSNNVDYVGETSLLFSANRMDGDISNTYNSPFRTPVANRHSSSTDSTSPDSFNTLLKPTPSERIRQRSEINELPFPYDAFEHTVYESYPNFDSPPHNTTLFGRNLLGTKPTQQFNTTSKPFDRNLPVFMSQNDLSQMCDTQFQLNERPIIGRKIVGRHANKPCEEMKFDTESDYSIWHPIQSSTPDIGMTYELFPSNENSFDIRTTPVKKVSDYMNYTHKSSVAPSAYVSQNESPKSSMSYYSDRVSPPATNRFRYTENLSPKMTNRVQYNENFGQTSFNRFSYPENLSQSSNRIPYPPFQPPYNPSSYAGAPSSHSELDPSKMCMFCRKNGETPTVYMGHNVKEKIGNKYKVTCPILRALVCVTCGASGDDAHTITYCPVLRSCNQGKPLQSTTITLKSTRIKSDGTKRNK